MLHTLQFFPKEATSYTLFTQAFNEQRFLEKEITGRIEKTSDINALKDEETQKTLLHFVTEKGMLDVAKQLIQKGANIEAQDKFQATPLHYAVKCSSMDEKRILEMIELFLQEGANIEARDQFQSTPLLYAIQSHQFNVVKRLIEASKDNQLSNWEEMKKLLKQRERERRGELSPLEKAVMTPVTEDSIDSAVKIIEFLKELEINRNREERRETLLHKAIRTNRDFRLIRSLLREEDINSENKKGETPYNYALTLLRNEELNENERKNATAIKELLWQHDVVFVSKKAKKGY